MVSKHCDCASSSNQGKEEKGKKKKKSFQNPSLPEQDKQKKLQANTWAKKQSKQKNKHMIYKQENDSLE